MCNVLFVPIPMIKKYVHHSWGWKKRGCGCDYESETKMTFLRMTSIMRLFSNAHTQNSHTIFCFYVPTVWYQLTNSSASKRKNLVTSVFSISLHSGFTKINKITTSWYKTFHETFAQRPARIHCTRCFNSLLPYHHSSICHQHVRSKSHASLR